jgi:hypothetical protein
MKDYIVKDPVTHKVLDSLSVSLREWYFRVGGFVLSDSSRDEYFALQDEIATALKKSESQQGDQIATELFESLREKGGALRASLSTDLRSRGQSIV